MEKAKLRIKVLPSHKEFEFMVLKMNNKYDPFLAFAIKINGRPSEDVHIYFQKRFLKTIVLDLGKKKENFRKVKRYMLFPKDLTYDQRADLRKEHLRLTGPRNMNKPEHLRLQPTELYKEWWPKVEFTSHKPKK